MFTEEILKIEQSLLSSLKAGEAFLEVGAELLSKSNIDKDFDLAELNRFFQLNDTPQDYAPYGFAKFNLTLTSNEHFSINIYFWGEGDKQTPLHAHPCEGVIKVLRGVTIDWNYKFKVSGSIAKGIDKVEVADERWETFNQGDVFTFDSGALNAHIPLKLGTENISLVIRGKNLREAQVRYAYPSLKFSNFTPNDKLERSLFILNRMSVSGQDINESLELFLEHTPHSEILYYLFLGKERELNNMKLKPLIIEKLKSEYGDFFKLLSQSNIEVEKRMKKVLFLAQGK